MSGGAHSDAPDAAPGAGRVLREVACLLAAALLGGVASAAFHPKAPPWTLEKAAAADPDALTWEQVQALDRPVLWVDARPRAEFEKGHIPGAVLLNQDDWEGGLDGYFENWTDDFQVVVYCGTAGCQASKKVTRRLNEEIHGVAPDDPGRARYLAGGWEVWKAKGPSEGAR